MQEAFHFPSLVWDWPIAIYLFLLGISAGATTLSCCCAARGPAARAASSRRPPFLAPVSVVLGLLILVFHLTRPWTFWKLMFHYSFTP